MKFRTKTILGIAAIETTLLVILVASTLTVLRSSNESELMRRVQLGGKLIAAAARDAVISQDLATLDSLVDEAMTSKQIDFVRILDARGAVLTQRGASALLERPFRQDIAIAQSSDNIYDWSQPVLAAGIRYGEVQLGVSTDPLVSLLASAKKWAGLIAVLEMLLVALFSWLFGSYLVRQLAQLRIASQAFAEGDFLRRVPITGNDELTQLGQAFNLMAEHLGQRDLLLRTENQMRLKAQQQAEFAKDQAEDRSEQLNAIFELSPDGFVSFDAAHRVKYANPAFQRLLGMKKGEIAELEEADFTAKLAQACTAEARFPGIEALGAMSGTKIELDNAERLVLEVGLRLSNAKSVSQILYFRDVTHETRVDRMKSEFLATAAHELRTPMASIYGYAELLLAYEFSAAEQREFLGTIHQQSVLMASLIDELLDLARIEGRRGKDFLFVPTELGALVQDSLKGYQPPEGRLSPQLHPAATPLWAKVDRAKLGQALNNLLSNAYKYSQGRVEVALITADAAEGERRGGIRIVDQGIGMTPEQLTHMGERFYRADASGKILGVGLGLSIVKGITELHGGQLQFDSQYGAGSTVTLWLPECTEQKGANHV